MRNLLNHGSYLFACLVGVFLLCILAACGPSDVATPTVAPTNSVPSVIEHTRWGGEGIGIEILTDSVKLRFRCDSGAIAEPLVTDSSGAFNLPGTFSWCPAMCVGDMPAHYQGQISGFPLTFNVSQLTLNVSWEYKGQPFTSGPFTATIGQEPKIEGACPECLSGNTLIDTPNGQVPVKDLRVGMRVWTALSDVLASGTRQTATVLKTSRTKVPADHKMVRLVLADGRELLASPGHPTADGRPIGTLSSGDLIDGTRVISADLVPYDEDYTYDILPSEGTGTYWANGILIGSTLARLTTVP